MFAGKHKLNKNFIKVISEEEYEKQKAENDLRWRGFKAYHTNNPFGVVIDE